MLAGIHTSFRAANAKGLHPPEPWLLQPKFIIADEPVSALDVSIQSQVLNILKDLQHEFNLTYLFIAHNFECVETYIGPGGSYVPWKVVEMTTREELFRNPLHPYTQALMSAIPIADPNHQTGANHLARGCPQSGQSIRKAATSIRAALSRSIIAKSQRPLFQGSQPEPFGCLLAY